MDLFNKLPSNERKEFNMLTVKFAFERWLETSENFKKNEQIKQNKN